MLDPTALDRTTLDECWLALHQAIREAREQMEFYEQHPHFDSAAESLAYWREELARKHVALRRVEAARGITPGEPEALTGG